MATSEKQKTQHNGLEAVQEILERMGVPGDADWMSVVLFVRNLVAAMTLFNEDQQAAMQAGVFEQMAKKPLDRKRFLATVHGLERALLESPRMEDLRSQLKVEQDGYAALFEEMNRILADIQSSSAERQTNIQRMGQDTEDFIVAAGSKAEVVRRLRGMINDMVSQARDEAKAWEERARQLERTANFDPLLSELYSRRALDAQLSGALERAGKNGAPLSLIFLDVDHFKTINDAHGHIVGDGVLRVLAAIISAHALQFGGYAARFGGEEIVVVCEGQTEAQALERAEAIRQDVSRCPFVPHYEGPEQPEPLHVTVSAGVAQLQPGGGAAELVMAADKAMYAAKLRGRDRVIAHSALTS